MRYAVFQMRSLMLFAFVLVVSGCGGERVVSTPIFPPSADLMVEAKPVPGPEIVESAQAAAEYDAAIEAWGERGWNAVARICRFVAGHGMAVSCPAASAEAAR